MKRSNALLSKCLILRELDRTIAERWLVANSQRLRRDADAERLCRPEFDSGR